MGDPAAGLGREEAPCGEGVGYGVWGGWEGVWDLILKPDEDEGCEEDGICEGAEEGFGEFFLKNEQE